MSQTTMEDVKTSYYIEYKTLTYNSTHQNYDKNTFFHMEVIASSYVCASLKRILKYVPAQHKWQKGVTAGLKVDTQENISKPWGSVNN